ncbi:MAG: alpha/beta hydrolase [Pseudomonadota bacterium]
MNIKLSNGCIHVETAGSGIPVLIMHGGGIDHLHMQDALEPVFEKTTGWKRIYIDLPGHGLSNADDTVKSQDDVLNMISEFLDVMFHGERIALIGESRGSYHAMGLAHIRPDDFLGMMLIVAGGMSEDTTKHLPKHQTLVLVPEEISHNASEEAIVRFQRLVVQKPEILEKIERTKVPAAKLVDKALAKRVGERFTFGFDLSNPTKRFEQPCLLLNGRQDSMAGYNDMLDALELYPHATLAILDRAGHSLSWEQPELFEALTIEWLERMRD